MDAPMHSRALYGAAVAVRKLGQVEGPHVKQLARRALIYIVSLDPTVCIGGQWAQPPCVCTAM